MAKDSKEFRKLMQTINSDAEMDIDYLHFGLAMPKDFIDFVTKNPELSETEMKLLLTNLGYILYKALDQYSNPKHPMVWNIGDKS